MSVKERKRKRPAQKAAVNPWPDRLLALRIELGLRQTEAAARIKISQSQWSSFESGKRTPTRPIAHLIELLESGKV